MEGFEPHTYGDAFADVYDRWYGGISDVAATVRLLAGLAGDGPVLELGVGTGRLAIPLAATGLEVIGVDTSASMLARLADHDPGGSVGTVLGDMVDDLPDRTFSLVFVAYNTLFSLTADGAQQACFDAVAARLGDDGRFVVEAFVPEDPPRRGDDVSIRTMSADRVVLSLSRHDPEHSAAAGQFVELTEEGGVRLRPWSIRYATPDELDGMAERSGLVLDDRCEDVTGRPFDPDESPRHVSTYRKPRV
jgi:SAM-dependent methyltransferase